MPDVFISYSRKNADFVRRLHDALGRANRDVWVDWEDIPLTADWWQEICAGIESADTFVLVVTPESLASPICTLELTHAAEHHKRLIPIIRADVDEKAAFASLAAHVPDDSLRATLAGRDLAALARTNWQLIARHNWLIFKEDSEFETSFQKLTAAVDTDLDYVRRHTRLLVRAREWDAQRRDASYLLKGTEIRDAEAFLAQSVNALPRPTDLHADYIIASQQVEIKQQRYEQRLQKLARDRLRLLIAMLAVGVVLLFIGFGWFYSFVNRATAEAASRSLETILEVTASTIDGDQFWALLRDVPPTRSGYPQDERYWQQAQTLYNIQEIDPRLSLYTYTWDRDQILYVGSSEALEQPPSGVTYLQPDEADASSLKWQGLEETVIEVNSYTDERGAYVSGYTPIRRSNGQTVGALGIDLRVDDYLAVPEQVLRTAALILLGLVILSVIGAVVFVVYRIRQRREMV